MGIGEIIRELKETGNKQAEQVRSEEKAETDKLKKEIERDASSEIVKVKEKYRREIDLEKKRIHAKATLQIKEQVEQKRSEVIDRVFLEAEKRVLSMNETGKKKILESLSRDGKAGVSNPTVFVDMKYAKLLKGAKAKGIGDFGVIVESGHVTVDNTLSAKLSEFKSGSRHKVAEVLWQN